MSVFAFGKSYKPDENTELMTTVYDFGTRAIVESLLREAEIPYIIKERGGSVPIITGSSLFGTDFFVRNTDLDVAAELIAPVFGEPADDEDAVEEAEENDGKSENE